MCWGSKCATLHTANQCKKKGHFCPNNREAKTDTDAYSEGRLKKHATVRWAFKRGTQSCERGGW
jgi:hypothetical protein